MDDVVFHDLRMSMVTNKGQTILSVAVESGHIEFEIEISVTRKDAMVIKVDPERAAFLQAALHRPFQLKETSLNVVEQRQYLDAILHAPKNETEEFLTRLDRGSANGAISNMVRITCGREQEPMRNGTWFQG